MATRKLHRSEFIRRLVARFPEMKARMRGGHDSLYMEVLEFLVFTQEAIDRGDAQLVGECFRFADESLADANGELRNALIVTYLEDLNLVGSGREFAGRLLTPRLRENREKVLAYLEQLLGPTRSRSGSSQRKLVRHRRKGSAA